MVPVANVQFMVFEVRIPHQQSCLIPPGISINTEKGGPHVVIHPVNLPAFATEILDHFAAYKAIRSSDK